MSDQSNNKTTIDELRKRCSGEANHTKSQRADPMAHNQPAPKLPPANEKTATDAPLKTRIIGASFLMEEYPDETPTLIDGLLRRGETANLIAATKVGKSWLSLQLAISIVTGTPWFGFNVSKGRVLILDNELRKPTLASRIRKVAGALEVEPQLLGDDLSVDALRGSVFDTSHMDSYFSQLEPREFDLILIDALYRTLPAGTSENDPGGMTSLFNAIDRSAERLDSAFFCVHHATKGDQSMKSVTDMGSGSGVISRAVDTHISIRPHEAEECAVMEAALRSFAPVDPLTIQWKFPIWSHKPAIEPIIKVPKAKGERRQESRDAKAMEKIKSVLEKKSKPQSMNYVRKQTGFGLDRMNRLVAKLKDAGEVKEIKKKGDKRKTRYFELSKTQSQTEHDVTTTCTDALKGASDR